MDYQLEIKQIVEYPRCRIYRVLYRKAWQCNLSVQLPFHHVQRQ